MRRPSTWPAGIASPWRPSARGMSFRRRNCTDMASEKTTAKTVARHKLMTVEDLDMRTGGARKAAEVRNQLLAERGGADRLSLLRKSMIGTLAVLNAMIEDLLSRWLAGQEIDHAALISLVNSRRREAE